MKRVSYAIAILGGGLIVYGLLTSALPRRANQVGAPVPNFTVRDLSGKSVTSNDLRGKVAVLDFWASWCMPCREELPLLQEVAAEFTRSDVAFLAISVDLESAAEVKDFLKNNKIRLPGFLDVHGSASEAFEVSALPTLIIINKQGRIISRHDGFAPATFKDEVRKELHRALQSQ